MHIPNIVYILVQHSWRNYYLATPFFIILDIFFNINIRIPFLDNWPVLKYIYYLMIFFLGFLISRLPHLTNKIAITESMMTISLLIIGFVYPYLMLRDEESVMVAMEAYSMKAVVNFAITAFMLYFGIFRMRFDEIQDVVRHD